jgi:hypothetical protein
VISLKDGELALQRTGGERHGLRASGPDTFLTEDDTEVRFERDAAGKVAAVVVDPGFGPLSRSPRTDEPPPAAKQTVEVAPELLEPLVGTYSLAPTFDIVITREGAHLFAQATASSGSRSWRSPRYASRWGRSTPRSSSSQRPTAASA